MRTIGFDPNAKSFTLATDRSRTIFVRTFPVVDFTGARSIVIATLQDVTDAFNGVLRSVVIKAGILFLVLSLIGIYAYVKFGQVRAALMGLVGSQERELAERIAFCDAATAKLKEVDLIKRGFFTNLVTAINEPLQAVTGQLTTLAPAVDKTADGAVASRLNFVLAETSRLSRLVEDYQQVELFRQKLVKSDQPLVSLEAVVARVVEEDLAACRRLPQLSIAASLPAGLPPTRADADLLRRAIGNLAAFAVQRSGQGTIVIAAAQDAEKWLAITISGSAFSGAAAPTEAVLDESRQFLARLSGAEASSAPAGVLIGVVLARIIVEFYGGTLSLAGTAAPGFIVRLPAAS
jgi:K+-sensing histidine kinase KdpD